MKDIDSRQPIFRVLERTLNVLRKRGHEFAADFPPIPNTFLLPRKFPMEKKHATDRKHDGRQDDKGDVTFQVFIHTPRL